MKKVLIGCGVIFLIVAVGIGVIGYQGYQWAKNSMPDMEQFTANRAELVEAYGHEDDYAPPLDGNYDPARVELFVDLRETMHPRVVALSSQIDAFHDGRNEGGGIGGFFSQMQAAMGAVGDLMVHAAYTDSLLLAREMGRGEYTHYQLVLTRGWMDLEADVLRWQDDMATSGADEEAIEAIRELVEEADTRAGQILRRQAQNLREAAADTTDAAIEAHAAFLATGNPELPFTDPVPPSLAAAFDDHASRLRRMAPTTIGGWLAETPALLDSEDGDGTNVQVDF